jgi:hypothetical protein
MCCSPWSDDRHLETRCSFCSTLFQSIAVLFIIKIVELRSYRLSLIFAFVGVAFSLPLCITAYVLSNVVDLLLVICLTLMNLSHPSHVMITYLNRNPSV